MLGGLIKMVKVFYSFNEYWEKIQNFPIGARCIVYEWQLYQEIREAKFASNNRLAITVKERESSYGEVVGK